MGCCSSDRKPHGIPELCYLAYKEKRQVDEGELKDLIAAAGDKVQDEANRKGDNPRGWTALQSLAAMGKDDFSENVVREILVVKGNPLEKETYAGSALEAAVTFRHAVLVEMFGCSLTKGQWQRSQEIVDGSPMVSEECKAALVKAAKQADANEEDVQRMQDLKIIGDPDSPSTE